MGTFSSKDFRDLLDAFDPAPCEFEAQAQPCDVPRNASLSSILKEDPRSPSLLIPRTPIEVSKAKFNPMIPSHLRADLPGKSNCTSERNLNAIDPRSPSLGIIRTPIQVACSCCDGASDTPKSRRVVADPRSPTIQMCRTPIQVKLSPAAEEKKYVSTVENSTELLETNLDELLNIDSVSPVVAKDKTVTERNLNSAMKEKKQDNKMPGEIHPSQLDKENEAALKRKLFATPERKLFATPERKLFATPERKLFATPDRKLVATPERKLFATPESSPNASSGLKVRTPLGTMSNLQQSPTQLLRMKQALRLEQELDPNIQVTHKSKGRKQQIVAWDRDSTFIM